MSNRDKAKLQRTVFVLAAAIATAALMAFCAVLLRSSNYSANITAPDRAVPLSGGPPEPSMEEPGDSYELVTVDFTGSLTLGSMLGSDTFGTFNKHVQEQGPEFFLQDLSDYLREDDLTVSVCDSVLSDSNSLEPVTKTDPEWSRGPVSNVDIFKRGGIELLSVASQRIQDYGEQGYTDTVQAIFSNGLAMIPENDYVRYEFSGMSAAVISGILGEDDDAVRELVKKARETSDLVAVYMFDTETGYQPSAAKAEAFRSFIDAGADIVAGTNGRNLQPAEEYNGGYIAYSLGCLIDGMNRYGERYSALLRCELRKGADGSIARVFRLVPLVTYTVEYQWRPQVLTEVEMLTQVTAFLNGEREYIEG